ncbi:DUF4136 domain-containing protein [Hymenobacter busanensis]|uniref:DUF4136 domain-containing protein n=1 Tax=Hymenobacter busanensis TaxID=2607656 RepID=A0A7L4ZS77_9BACT|nr:DUF4136 domain-containing protein [Hymenobacter busanensis]KAA9327523.1 DUF4136 domain-containing protein [Hymenobacter busanensis]QHJ06139.1 DUF4136 domain-containing protein [Hymenobacter busanensis]
MKILRLAAGLLLSGALAAGCASSDSSAVEVGSTQAGGADVSSGPYIDMTGNSSNFRSYKTYGWASQVMDSQNNSYFLNDAAYKTRIKDAVEHELNARGYTYQASNPDFMVNFRVFDQPTEIKNPSNYGQGFWTNNEARGFSARPTYKLDAGSLIVQLVDVKGGDLVWQGYASGLLNGDQMDKEATRIDKAVSDVFERYSYNAR